MAMSIHNAHNGEPSVVTVGNMVHSLKQINAAKHCNCRKLKKAAEMEHGYKAEEDEEDEESENGEEEMDTGDEN